MLQYREALWRAEYVCAREQRPYSKSDQPAGNPKAVFWTGLAQAVTAEEWFEHASKESGSWWPHWLSWVQNRIGGEKAGARQTGHGRIPPFGRSPWPVCDGEIIEDRLTRGGRTSFCGSAFAPGDKSQAPLLSFNGIGANIELVEPLLDILDGPEAIIFDVPGVGGSPPPRVPYRPWHLVRLTLDYSISSATIALTFSACRGEERFPTICVSAGEALPAPGTCGNLPGPHHGAPGKLSVRRENGRVPAVTGILRTWAE